MKRIKPIRVANASQILAMMIDAGGISSSIVRDHLPRKAGTPDADIKENA